MKLRLHITIDYGEEYYQFCKWPVYNAGRNTSSRHFAKRYVKTIRDFYKKDYDAADIRGSIVAAISVRVQEPVFESQTKTKLGSQISV